MMMMIMMMMMMMMMVSSGSPMRISQAISNMTAYASLSDNLLDTVQHSWDPRYKYSSPPHLNPSVCVFACVCVCMCVCVCVCCFVCAQTMSIPHNIGKPSLWPSASSGASSTSA
jgi:hypothetical protein